MYKTRNTHAYVWLNDVTILNGNRRSKFKRKTSESLYIRSKKWTLNTKEPLMKINLFYWTILHMFPLYSWLYSYIYELYIRYITICFCSIDNYQFKSSKGMAWHCNLPMWCYLTCWVCAFNTSYVFHFLTVLLDNLFNIVPCKFFRIFYIPDAARWSSTKKLFLLINKHNFYN